MMRGKVALLPLIFLCGFGLSAVAQQMCPPRPAPGTAITNPLDLYSTNGILTLNLSLQSQVGPTGFTWYCYVYMNNGMPVEAPTLRVNPGDRLVINFTNNITVTGRLPKSRHAPMAPMEMGDVHGAMAQSNPCLGGMVTATTTNIHFHGLNIAPVCHQDEVVKTIIPNNGLPFQYSLVIPANDPPGLYWYHPHPHGFSAPQVYGGAAGALIIGGTNVLTQGLPERVLTIRRNVDAVTDDDGQFTLNFEPANFPRKPLPVINMTGGQSEFWRVLNASTNGFLALQLVSGGVQPLQVISIDGIPLTSPVSMTTIYLPPAGRAEFIVPALVANTASSFVTQGFNTGPIGDPMPATALAKVIVAPGKYDGAHTAHTVPPPTEAPRFSGLASVTPTTTHSLYFSELNVGTNGPGQFFITEAGHKQILFNAKNGPAITSKSGTVEDWTISNQTGESHAFHIHQLHFLVMAINGVSLTNPYLADTITVPNWTGSGSYPSVTLRMDFRDPNIIGTFVYHCHILDHEDGGMMATIVVTP
jgi:FtsP/CotA-like multicopper oxidase with cupredoxin domain